MRAVRAGRALHCDRAARCDRDGDRVGVGVAGATAHCRVEICAGDDRATRVIPIDNEERCGVRDRACRGDRLNACNR